MTSIIPSPSVHSSLFTTKHVAVDWGQLSDVDPDKLRETEDDVTLEELYPYLVKCSVDLENDPQATKENLLKLFRLSQLIMETKHLFLEDAEKQITVLQTQQLARAPSRSTNRLGPSVSGYGLDRTQSASLLTAPSPNRPSASPSQQDLAQQEITSLRTDLDTFARQVTDLRTDLAAAEELAAAERLAAMQLRDELRAERAKVRDAEGMMDALQATIRDLKAGQIKSLGSRKVEDDLRAELREKNGMVARYLGEVQTVAAQNAALSAEVTQLEAEVEAVISELDRVTGENDEIKAYIARADERVEKAEADRENLERQVKELTKDMLRREEADQTPALQAEIASLKQRLVEAQFAAESKVEIIEKLQGEITTLKSESLQPAVDDLRRTISERDEELAELKRKLEESYRDFELLSQDWHTELNQRKVATPAPPTDAGPSKQVVAMLESRIEALTDRQLSLVEQNKRLDKLLVAKERELRDVRLENDQLYAVGAAEHARAELIRIREQLALRDADLAAQRATINDLQAAADELAEENAEFRLKYNLGEPLPEERRLLARKRETEVSRLNAVNSKLLEEINSLENERIELKRQVRLQALERGERALKLGLTVEQLYALESLADRMRSDANVLCLCNSADLAVENKELTEHVKSLRSEIARLRQLEGERRNDARPASPFRPASTATTTPVDPVRPTSPSSAGGVVRVTVMEREVMTDPEGTAATEPHLELSVPPLHHTSALLVVEEEGSSQGQSTVHSTTTSAAPSTTQLAPTPIAATSTAAPTSVPPSRTVSNLTSSLPNGSSVQPSVSRSTSASSVPLPPVPPPHAVETADEETMCRLDVEHLPADLAAGAANPSTVAALYHCLLETLVERDDRAAAVAALESAVAAANADAASLEARVAQLQSAYDASRTAMERNAERLRDAEHALSDARVEVNALREALAAWDVSASADAVQSRLTELTRTYVSQTVELRAVKRKNLILTGWNESAQARVEAMVADHATVEEGLRKQLVAAEARVESLEAENTKLTADLVSAVPEAELRDAERQLAEETARRAKLELANADLMVHEAANLELTAKVADLESKVTALTEAKESLASQLAAYQAQVLDMTRLEETDARSKIQDLRRQLADSEAARALAESRAKLQSIQRDALDHVQKEHLAMIETLQRKLDDLGNQNSALVEALQSRPPFALSAPSAGPAVDTGESAAKRHDRSVPRIEVEALRQQLDHWQRENRVLTNANRRFRLLLADLQLESDQTMLLGQAHHQLTDYASQLASLTVKCETLTKENHALQIAVAEHEATIHRQAEQTKHLRTSLLLQRQEHRLVAASLQHRVAQSVSSLQFQRVKDSLDLAMQHIRRLSHPMPAPAATAAADGESGATAATVTELRIENLRLSRQIQELQNLHEFKARELEHLHRTLTDTEKSYLELISVHDAARAEYSHREGQLQDELRAVRDRLAMVTANDPANKRMAEQLSAAELQIMHLSSECDFKTKTIARLEEQAAALDAQVRKLDATLIQYQLHGVDAAASRDRGADARAGTSRSETMPLAVAQQLVGGLQAQLRGRQKQIEALEASQARLVAQLKDISSKARRESLTLHHQLADTGRDRDRAHEQLSAANTAIESYQEQLRQALAAQAVGGSRTGLGGMVQESEESADGSGEPMRDANTLGSAKSLISSLSGSQAALMRGTSLTALLDQQQEQFAALLAERDQAMVAVQHQLERERVGAQQAKHEAEARHAELESQIQHREQLISELEAALRESVPRQDYHDVQQQLVEQRQAVETLKRREQALQRVIDQLRSDLVETTAREMEAQRGQRRMQLLDQGAREAREAHQACAKCEDLANQLREQKDRHARAITLKGVQIRKLEAKLAEVENLKDAAEKALLDVQSPAKSAQQYSLAQAMRDAEHQLKAQRDQLEKATRRADKAEAKVHALESDLEKAKLRASTHAAAASASTRREAQREHVDDDGRVSAPADTEPKSPSMLVTQLQATVRDLQSKLTATVQARAAATKEVRTLRDQVAELQRQLEQGDANHEAALANVTAAVIRAQKDERRAKRQAAAADQRAEEAREAVARLEKTVQQLQQQLAMRARVGGGAGRQRQKQEAQPTMSVIPPALLEELEDLKANYEQSVELNLVYEQELARLGGDAESLRRAMLEQREPQSAQAD
ncbi:hypothetical protein H9P43_001819 [Blastocladiella emersonii ATCC 22665]|nr:hypothetical protein H9P43_001819 [Blastocladiella emersonii ATCC 22665]